MAIFVVKPKGAEHDEKKHRLVKAVSLAAVREHLMQEFNIARAEPEETHDLAVLGVKIEDATQQ